MTYDKGESPIVSVAGTVNDLSYNLPRTATGLSLCRLQRQAITISALIVCNPLCIGGESDHPIKYF